METGLDREDHGLCFFTSPAIGHHIWDCHYLVVVLTIQRLQGSAACRSHQLSVIPLLVARGVDVLHDFKFYGG